MCFLGKVSYSQSFPKDYFNSKYPNVTTCIINDYDSLNPILGQDSILFEVKGPTNYHCTTIQVAASEFVINMVDTATVVPPVASEKFMIVTKEEIVSGNIDFNPSNHQVKFELVGDTNTYIYTIAKVSAGTVLKRVIP